MKDSIVIQFDPFDKESRVFVYKDGKTQVTQVASSLTELTQNISNLVWAYGVNDVKISAPSKIVEELRQKVLEYSNKEINIEEI